MSKDRDDELNTMPPGDDIPSFTLEEILAEYSVREKRPPPETIPIPMQPQGEPEPPAPAKKPPGGHGTILSFPGAAPPEPERKPPPPVQAAEPEPVEQAPPPAPPPPPPKKQGAGKHKPKRMAEGNVLPFSEQAEHASPVAAKLNRLKHKADEFSEHMFEEEDSENDTEVRRAEQFIPGVDEEEPPPHRERKPRRQPPPAPDLSPKELFYRYSKGLGMLKLRAILVLMIAAPLLFLTLAPSFGFVLPGPLGESQQLQVFVLAGLQLGAMLLGIDVWARGLLSILSLRMGMDSLMALSCAATLADALTLTSLGGREGQLPYCAGAVLALGCCMWGAYLKRRGNRAACRTAASASEPYLVTLDEGKWNGRDTYTKWSGEPIGFGRQIQGDDGAQRIFHVTAPLLFLGCLLFSMLASVGRERPEHLLWCLAATLSAASSLSGMLCFSVPWNRLCQRLAKSGAALAGWDGVTGTGGSSGILLTDFDLFPPGSVSMNGIKVFGDFPVEKVVGYAATLIRDSGSGLNKIFHDLLRSQGAVYRRATDFCCYEGGGVSAIIRNEAVLVGSASFMHLMEVTLPQGLNVKNAVFCAIEGELAGIFALKYTLHGAVEPALNALIRNRVSPVLATRDFNVIPGMLRQRFKLPVEKMDFPPVERRMELSGENQEHSEFLSAVLCREGLGPYSEAVVGGKRLRAAVRISAALASTGAAVGVLLAFYLTFSGAYASLSPGNLLVFLIMWFVPTPLIAGWVNRF